MVFIRGYLPLDNGFTQTVGAGNIDDLLKAGLGIDSGQDSGAGGVGSDHFLNADGQGQGELIKALVVPVTDGPIGKERGKTAFDGLNKGNFAANIEEGFLLAAKGLDRRFFHGDRGADGHIQVGAGQAVEILQIFIGLADFGH